MPVVNIEARPVLEIGTFVLGKGDDVASLHFAGTVLDLTFTGPPGPANTTQLSGGHLRVTLPADAPSLSAHHDTIGTTGDGNPIQFDLAFRTVGARPERTVLGSYTLTEVVPLVRYGRTPNYDAGTAADFYVDYTRPTNGTGTLANPFNSINAALAHRKTLPASPAIEIAVRGASEKNYEKIRFDATTLSNTTLKRYGAETPRLSGGRKLTGWTQCTVADQPVIGARADYSKVWKCTVPKAGFESTWYYACYLTENDVRRRLVGRRADTSSDFELHDNRSFWWIDDNGVGEDITTTTPASAPYNLVDWKHPSKLNGYTAAQLMQMYFVWHGYPNVTTTVRPSLVTTDGTGDKVVAVTGGPQLYDPVSASYAMYNNLPDLAAGEWGVYDGGGSDITFYLWPEDTANLANGIEVGARNSIIQVTVNGISNVRIAGFELSHVLDGAHINMFGASNHTISNVVIEENLFTRISGSGRPSAVNWSINSSGVIVRRNDFVDLQNSYGNNIGGTGGRIHNNRFYNCSQTGTRVLRGTYLAIYDNEFEVVGWGPHANKANIYQESNWVIFARNRFVDCPAYLTNQASSNILFLMNWVPNGPAFGGYIAFKNQGGPAAGANPTTLYHLNNFYEAEHDNPPLNTQKGVVDARSATGLTHSMRNNIIAGFDESIGVPAERIRNIMTFNGNASGGTGNDIVADRVNLYYDYEAGDYRAVPGSLLVTKTGESCLSVIEAYESQFPDLATAGTLRKTIAGKTWDPADPGMGPYGKSWPIAPDTAAPVLSGLSASVSGTGATCQVTTNEIGGRIYWVTVPNGAATPSPAQVVAGLEATGAAALNAGSKAVGGSVSSPFKLAVTGVAGETHKLCVTHQDRHGNIANVATINLAFTAFVPTFVNFTGTTGGKKLVRSTALSGAQPYTDKYLFAITMRRNSGAASAHQGVIAAPPTTIDLGASTSWLRAFLAVSHNRDGSLLGAIEAVADLSAARTAGTSGLILISYSSTPGGGRIARCRAIRLDTGVVNSSPLDDKDAAADRLLSWASSVVSTIQLFKGNGANTDSEYERVVVWDNPAITPDAADSALQALFHNAGALKDPAVAKATLGRPLWEIYGAFLNDGLDTSGNGNDFKPTTI